MKEKLNQIKKIVDSLLLELDSNEQKTNEEKTKVTAITNYSFETSEDEFEHLKKILHSSDWPEAVMDFQIADETSEEDKKERAEGIADIILPVFEGKRFLDFGCGDGHVVHYVSKESSVAVGYDLKKPDSSVFKWEEKEDNLLLTTDFEKVQKEGPYDIILIYDVLDHSEEDIDSVLSKAKSVLSKTGKIYLRCHPYSSRHGGHIYKQLNKAFVHLLFTEEELNKLGLNLIFNRKIRFPLSTYNEAIKKSGLKVEAQEIDDQEVEPFFEKNEITKKRLLEIFETTNWTNHDRPVFQMSQCFIDYVLSAE